MNASARIQIFERVSLSSVGKRPGIPISPSAILVSISFHRILISIRKSDKQVPKRRDQMESSIFIVSVLFSILSVSPVNSIIPDSSSSVQYPCGQTSSNIRHTHSKSVKSLYQRCLSQMDILELNMDPGN